MFSILIVKIMIYKEEYCNIFFLKPKIIDLTIQEIKFVTNRNPFLYNLMVFWPDCLYADPSPSPNRGKCIAHKRKHR